MVRLLLDAGRFKDPIARGLAAAAAAHGFGTAALSAREPETLPYCALSCELRGGVSRAVRCICSGVPVL